MSTCISRHGEYSDHQPDDEYTCTRCFVLDEDAMREELHRLRTDAPHQSDETPTSARPHRPTSTEPVDDRTRARYLERLALAASHAHEADRLADNSRDAGTIHAHLAQFWLDLAKEQRP